MAINILSRANELIRNLFKEEVKEAIEIKEEPMRMVKPIDYGEKLYQVVLKAKFPLLYHAVLYALKTWAKEEIRPYELHSRILNALCELTGQKDWKVSYKAIGLVLTRLGIVRERIRQGKRGRLAIYRINLPEVNQYIEAISKGIEGRLGCVLPSYRQYQNWKKEAEKQEKIISSSSGSYYGEIRKEEAKQQYELLRNRLRDYFGIEMEKIRRW